MCIQRLIGWSGFAVADVKLRTDLQTIAGATDERLVRIPNNKADAFYSLGLWAMAEAKIGCCGGFIAKTARACQRRRRLPGFVF